MKLEHLQAIINAHPLVNLFETADDNSRDETNRGSVPHSHEAGGRRNPDQPCDRSFTGTNDGKLLASEYVVEDRPAENTRRRRKVGVPDSDHAANTGVESGAAIEPEPSKPDQDRSKEDDSDIVRFINVLLAMSCTLAEYEGVS